jgi:hypothetical protein
MDENLHLMSCSDDANVFFFSFFDIKILGRFFKKLAKLVKLTLEKKCSLFFCQNKQ